MYVPKSEGYFFPCIVMLHVFLDVRPARPHVCFNCSELYDLLTHVVDSFPRNAVVTIGGELNATVGGPQAGDDADTVQEINVVPN